jgi:quercetin dioxygenase-like cupin family protein
MRRPLAFAVAALAATLSVGVAVATPGTGVVGPILARTIFDPIGTSQTAGLDAVIQEVTIAPGGHTGWHAHPGGTVILVESGFFTIYNNTCTATDVAAGRGIVEPGGQVQLARNNSTTDPLVLTVVYFDVPVGGPVRSDATAPACAAGAGLPTVAAGSGVTAAPIISRATFAAGASITGADERDVVVQQVTIAPGGHTGWHSHPGATVILVQSGTFTFYSAADCIRQNFVAGQGAVEAGGGVQLARNEGTVPQVLYVVYFDVPVGGAFRVDQPEPSNCTGLAAVPAPTPTPTPVPAPTPTATAPPTAAPTPQLPETAMLTGHDSTSPAPVVPFLLVAFVAGLLALGPYRARSRR